MTDMLTGMRTEEEFLAHIGATPEMTEDEFLEHFGVKGMRWGHSKGSSSAPKLGPDGKPAKTRKELRGLNKASRQAETDKWNSDIDDARSRTEGKANRVANKKMLKDAKTQFKVDKKVIGSREARKALASVREKHANDLAVAARAKTGRETVNSVISTLAVGILVNGLK